MDSSQSRELRQSAFDPRVVLLTGGSGYLGTLIAAKLLASADCTLIVPLRPGSSPDSLRERLDLELQAQGQHWERVRDRVRFIEWPGAEGVRESAWTRSLDGVRIDEIIHCAGCLDYFDGRALVAVNIDLTQALIDLGKQWNIRRFTYISTAYSAGYVDGRIEESIHAEPLRDPTEYTRTKRAAERLVATSGLPWLIVRPSILVGEWASGRYSGKRYGVYQQWMGLERLMCDRYHAEIHTVAPQQPLNLLHQDAFQAAFGYGHAWMPDNSVLNLVSDHQAAPSMRSVWALWMEIVRPQKVFYYPSFEDMDLKAINMRQRAYLTFAQVNLEIGAHPWHFDSGWLNRLRAHGLEFHDASLESTSRCLDRFVAGSDVMESYRTRFGDQLAEQIEWKHVQPERSSAHEAFV